MIMRNNRNTFVGYNEIYEKKKWQWAISAWRGFGQKQRLSNTKLLRCERDPLSRIHPLWWHGKRWWIWCIPCKSEENYTSEQFGLLHQAKIYKRWTRKMYIISIAELNRLRVSDKMSYIILRQNSEQENNTHWKL